MSDSTQGEGWWQASDGKWYPPDQHPEYTGGAPTEAVDTSQPPPTTSMPPTSALPPVAPIPSPGEPPIGGPPPGAPGAGSSNARWFIIGGVAAVAIAIAAFLLLRSDDKKQNASTTSD